MRICNIRTLARIPSVFVLSTELTSVWLCYTSDGRLLTIAMLLYDPSPQYLNTLGVPDFDFLGLQHDKELPVNLEVDLLPRVQLFKYDLPRSRARMDTSGKSYTAEIQSYIGHAFI